MMEKVHFILNTYGQGIVAWATHLMRASADLEVTTTNWALVLNVSDASVSFEK